MALLQVGDFGVLVDDEDVAMLSEYHWTAKKTKGSDGGIRRVVIQGWRKGNSQKKVYMSRVVMNAPSGLQVDHIDHNTLDNRKQNLRVCTNAENSRNRPVRTVTGYKGVSEVANCYSRFAAAISIDRKLKHLGIFSSARSAAIAYDNAAREHYGAFACLNFPDLNEPTPVEPAERSVMEKYICLLPRGRKGFCVQIGNNATLGVRRYVSRAFPTVEAAVKHRDAFLAGLKELGPFEQDWFSYSSLPENLKEFITNYERTGQ